MSELSPEKDARLSEDIEKLDGFTLKAAKMLQRFDQLVDGNNVTDESLDELEEVAETEGWSDLEKDMLKRSIQRVKEATAASKKYAQEPDTILEELGIKRDEFKEIKVNVQQNLPGIVEIQVANSNELDTFLTKINGGSLAGIFHREVLANDRRDSEWIAAQHFRPEQLGLKDSKLLGIIIVRADGYEDDKEHKRNLRHEYSHASIAQMVRPVLHHYFTGIKPNYSGWDLKMATAKMSTETRSKLEQALGDFSFLGMENVLPYTRDLIYWKILQQEQDLLDELRAYSFNFNFGLPQPTLQMTKLVFREPVDDYDREAIDPKMAERFFHVHLLRIKAGIMSQEKRGEALGIIGASQSLSQAAKLLKEATAEWSIGSQGELERILDLLKFVEANKKILLGYSLGEKVLIDMDRALAVVSPPKEMLDAEITRFYGTIPKEYEQLYQNLYGKPQENPGEET